MRVPLSTYRVQIHAGFTLRDALDLVPYLRQLGISHLYLSPVFEATPGSTHGYDVTDPTRVSSAIGGIDALRELAAAAQAHDMGIVLDIVPNHMAASEINPWWYDVLERGRSSEFAGFFDIAWTADDRILLPILGDEPAAVIDRGEIALEAADGNYALKYFDRRLPVAAGSCPAELAEAAVCDVQHERSSALRRLLHAQHYELVCWTRTTREIGYRRFFDIIGLAGVRVELDSVFDATHGLVRELVADNIVDGLRIDHVDGLRDPAAYLRRLRETVHADGPVYTVVEKILELGESLPDWPVEGTTGYDFLNDVSGLFIDPDGMPRLHAQYRRMTGSDASFEDVVREKKQLVLARLFAGELNGLTQRLQNIVKLPAESSLRPALALVTASLPVYRTYIVSRNISAVDRANIDVALNAARAAAARQSPDAVACVDTIGRVLRLEVDDALYDDALDFVQRWQQLTGPVMAKGVEDTALYTFTALTSANEVGGGPGQPCVSVGEFHDRMLHRRSRMPHTMNTTDTHDTKRGEDVRTRIHALTELAGEWTRLLREWVSRSEVYKEEAQEETGADLADDAAVPDAKEEILLYQTLVGAWPIPLRRDSEEVTPAFTDRIREYMRKAVREAKDNTSWARPDEDYETTLDAFIERLLRAPSRPRLRAEIASFAQGVAWHGMLSSVAQTLLKAAAPGIPDFYQGTELWSLTLVDPDNRRPVDFTARAELLAQIAPALDTPTPEAVRALFDDWEDGRVKLYLITQALRLRRAHPDLFTHGEYIPVHAVGTHADRVVAFARRQGDEWCLTVVPRITMPLADGGQLPIGDVWGDTQLDPPDGLPLVWRNVITAETPESLNIADIFAHVPVFLGENA